MNSECAIFAEFDADKIIILPSEITARSYLTGYAKKHAGKAVFSDHVLSWDTFKKSYTEIPAGKEKAQAVHRMLFVSQFFQSHQINKLKHFANCEYRESSAHFARNTAENLKYFRKALLSDNIGKTIKEDVSLLYDAYNVFLEKNNLYEENYLEADYSKADKDKYVIVYPDAVSDTDIKVAIDAGFRTITVSEDDELNGIDVYENSICEIKSTVRQVFELLKTENASDIAITLSQFDSYYPYLESECRIRDIKLSPSKGKTLDQYAGGRFFKDIQSLRLTDFDMEALKTFLFNPLYPFRNRSLLSQTIRTGIKNKIQNGVFNWKKKLEKLNTAESLRISEFIRKLSVYVQSFSDCKNADELRKTFHNFQDDFFENDSWHTLENEVEKQAFERVLVLIDDIDKAMRKCDISSLENYYDIFLSLLECTVYTSNIKTEGIKVFSYPTTVALNVKHHFVLSLSDKNAVVKRIAVPFDDEEKPEDTITDSIIKSYALKTENNTYLSCSEESFDSSSSAPAVFVEKELVKTITGKEEDSFRAEAMLYKRKDYEPSVKSLPNQKIWYNSSKEKLLKGLKREEYSKQALPVKLNAYKISSFKKCPYRYLCSYVYRLNDEDDYSTDMSDFMSVGTLLHDTYKDFFNKVRNFEDFSEEQNKELLEKIFTEKLNDYSSEVISPDQIQIIELSAKYRDLLKHISDAKDSALFNDYITEEMEKDLSIVNDEYQINGKIDCILKAGNGDLAVIDFKKKNTDKESLQLVVYANLLSGSAEYSKIPVLAALYSIEEEKFVIKWKNEEEFKSVNFEFQKTMNEIVNKTENGDFAPTPSSETCSNCNYSRLCRKRFVIK